MSRVVVAKTSKIKSHQKKKLHFCEIQTKVVGRLENSEKINKINKSQKKYSSPSFNEFNFLTICGAAALLTYASEG